VKRIYGVLEDQFRRYFEQAERTRGITGETLLQLLERRLDNVAYRLGLATSRAQARQLVRHGHLTVNGRKVDIPSFSVKPGDVVTVRQSSHKVPAILHALEEVKGRGVPEWLQFDAEGMSAKVGFVPDARADQPARAGQLDCELYSKVGTTNPMNRIAAQPEDDDSSCSSDTLRDFVYSQPSPRRLSGTAAGGRWIRNSQAEAGTAGPLRKDR
jgi:small subunit ribosomal protein S4